ncbi:histidine phosphatase family protein [Pelagibacteraceae bacterium]|nr:histidine phosphatase family protein [Pelagibacteraceae bacterium]
MRNNCVPRLIFSIILLLFFFQNLSAEINWPTLQEGNKILLIRHASAPGGGDPEGFKIHDCSTQRNLDKIGILQSKNIGKLLKNKFIPIDKVLTSQWCRCKDTAKYAFKNFEEFSALNSVFQTPFIENEEKQIKEIRRYVRNWKPRGKNLVMITHYSIITKLTNSTPSSGEIVVVDKYFNILERISTLKMGFFY